MLDYVSYSSYLYYDMIWFDIDMIWTQKYFDTVAGAVIVLDWLLVRLLLGSQKKDTWLDSKFWSTCLICFFDQVWNI